MSKFSKMFLRGCAIGSVGLALELVSTEMEIPTANVNLSVPASFLFVPTHPFKSTAGSGCFHSVCSVLLICAGSNVLALIVQAIVVAMVVKCAVGQPCPLGYNTMHRNPLLTPTATLSSDRVPLNSVRFRADLRVPFPLDQVFVIGVIDNGGLSLSERYDFHSSVLGGSALFTRLADPLSNFTDLSHQSK